MVTVPVQAQAQVQAPAANKLCACLCAYVCVSVNEQEKLLWIEQPERALSKRLFVCFWGFPSRSFSSPNTLFHVALFRVPSSKPVNVGV